MTWTSPETPFQQNGSTKALPKRWLYSLIITTLFIVWWTSTLLSSPLLTPESDKSSLPPNSFDPSTVKPIPIPAATLISPPAPPPSPPAAAKHVAVIVETRPLDTMVPLILHFSTVLGPTWPIYVVIGENRVPASMPFQAAIDAGRIIIKHLPPTITFTDHDSVSAFLTVPWLWEQMAPAEHVLLFQADAIVCANAPIKVDDFLEYDFVGAPIDPNLGRRDEGMNGGFSLRNRSATLDIVNKYSWKKEYETAEDPSDPKVRYEDQWFNKKFKDLGMKMPDLETASKFSVESIWYDRPVGYHKIDMWNGGRVEEIDKYCPEHRLATNLPVAALGW